MARVFSNSMVAHIWAQQTQEAGRSNNGQFYFEGRELYSYGSHFLVGFIMPDGTALLNSDSYSPTTGKHQSYARSAVRGKYLSVPKLTDMRYLLRNVADADAKTYKAEMKRDIAQRIGGLNAEAQQYLGSLVGLSIASVTKVERDEIAKRRRDEVKRKREFKARQVREAKYYAAKSDADFNRSLTESLAAYSPYSLKRESVNVFRLIRDTKGKLTKAETVTLKARMKRLRLALKEYETRQVKAKQFKDARNAIAMLRQVPKDTDLAIADEHIARHVFNSLRSLLALDCLGSTLRLRFTAVHNQAVERSNELKRQAAAAEFERQTEKREAWLRGEGGYLAGRASDENGNALMRIKGDNLETSWGATVPLVHAVKVFRFVKLCRMNKTPWQRNGHTIRVGHFTVDRIEPSGDFTAGCHSFSWDEVERVAKLAGVYGETASAEAIQESK